MYEYEPKRRTLVRFTEIPDDDVAMRSLTVICWWNGEKLSPATNSALARSTSRLREPIRTLAIRKLKVENREEFLNQFLR